jgi:hypothetical protein
VTYAIAKHIAWQRIGDQVVLVDLESAIAVGLNPVASFVFPLLDNRDEASLVAAISDEFDVDPGVARTDLRAFVSQLVDQQMLESPEAG